MKSSLALVIEQLLRLDPFLELHFDVVLSILVFSFPLLQSDATHVPLLVVVVTVVGAVVATIPGEFVVSFSEPGGDDVCFGVNKELNGTSGITKSSSLTTTCLFITNAPTLIVSLRDFDVSSLEKRFFLIFDVLTGTEDGDDDDEDDDMYLC